MTKIRLILQCGLLVLCTGCSDPNPAAPEDSLRKIEFDLDGIDEDGLRGPPGGKTSVSYEFAIPNTEKCKEEVRRIDSTIEFMSGSRGRVQAEEGESLCIGSTHQANYQDVLQRLSELSYVKRIIECHFE